MKEIKDFLLQTKTQSIIALIIIVTGFTFLAFAKGSELTNGRVSDLMFLMATFYFGSSKSSAKKDETIANMTDNLKN